MVSELTAFGSAEMATQQDIDAPLHEILKGLQDLQSYLKTPTQLNKTGANPYSFDAAITNPAPISSSLLPKPPDPPDIYPSDLIYATNTAPVTTNALLLSIPPSKTPTGMLPLKFSCEEVYERMEIGLCVFCDELDTPGHQLKKHKNLQLLIMECDDAEQFYGAKESVESVVEVAEADLSIQEAESPVAEDMLVTTKAKSMEDKEEVSVTGSICLNDMIAIDTIQDEVSNPEKESSQGISLQIQTLPYHQVLISATEQMRNNQLQSHIGMDISEFGLSYHSDILLAPQMLVDIKEWAVMSLKPTFFLHICEGNKAIGRYEQANHVWKPGGLLSTQTHWYLLQKTLEMIIQPVNEKVSLEVHYVPDLEAYIGLDFYGCKKQMLLLVKESNHVWEPGEILIEHDKWKKLELFVWLVSGKMLLDTGQEMQLGMVYGETKSWLKNFEPGNKKEKDTLSEDVMLLVFLGLRKSCSVRGEGVHDIHILLLVKGPPKESPTGVSDSDNQEESLLTDKLLGENSHITWQFLKSKLRLVNGSLRSSLLRSSNALSETGFCYRSYSGFDFAIGDFNSGSLMLSILVSRFIHTLLVISKIGACSLLNTEAYMSPRQLQNKNSSVLVGLKDDETMLVVLVPDMVVSYLLKVHHKQAKKMGKQKYFIEKIDKSIILIATCEYKDIETSCVLLGLGLNEYAHKVPYLVKGYGDKDIIKLRVVGCHDMSLMLFYGSLPRPPDFVTIKESLEGMFMHEKDHKLLFPKNHNLLRPGAGFWTQYNNLEQLSIELQSSPGLNYFTHLVFLRNQALYCGCKVDHSSSGIFYVVSVHEFDNSSKLQIGNVTQGKRLLYLTEVSPLLDNANEADLVVKGNWFHNNPTIEEVFHLLRPPELLELHGYPASVTKYSELSSLRTRMLSTREYCDRNITSYSVYLFYSGLCFGLSQLLGLVISFYNYGLDDYNVVNLYVRL